MTIFTKHKAKKIILCIALSLLLLITSSAIAFKIYASNYYKADAGIISEIESQNAATVTEYNEDTLLFVPADANRIKAGIVFYPGGKVEYTAYSGLMYELAQRGYMCILTRMPENLAFLDIDAANGYDDLISSVPSWYIAGHSLGGVAAGMYIDELIGTGDTMPFDGIILLASYITEDFSDTSLRLLSIYGSNDGVINLESYKENKVNWPADNTEYILDGGIHSFFGCYGIQSGDGKPAMTNVEQIKQTAAMIDSWIQ